MPRFTSSQKEDIKMEKNGFAEIKYHLLEKCVQRLACT